MFDFPITSPLTNEITAALIAAQSSFPVLRPDSKVEIRRDKEHRYASLGAVLEAIRGPLNANGIAYTQVQANLVVTPARKRVKGQPATPAVREQFLVTTLLHTSGQWIRSYYPIPQAIRIDPQAVGSQLTYARRYSIAGITGLAIDIDDDGQAARPQADRKRGAPLPQPTWQERMNPPGTGDQNREAGCDDEPAPRQAPASKGERRTVKKRHTGAWLAEATRERKQIADEFTAIGKKLGYPRDFREWTEDEVNKAIDVRAEGFQQ